MAKLIRTAFEVSLWRTNIPIGTKLEEKPTLNTLAQSYRKSYQPSYFSQIILTPLTSSASFQR